MKLFDRDAEVGVLGSMMIDHSLVDRCNLIEDDFYTIDHKLIYRAILTALRRYSVADPITVRECFASDADFNRAGGVQYLADVYGVITETESALYHAKILRERTLRRRVIARAENAIALAKSHDEVETLVAQVQSDAISLSKATDKERTRSITEDISEVFSRITSDGGFLGLMSGIWDWDLQCGGLQPGELTIIAARASMGKTAFALSIAQHLTVERNLPVLFFSAEMPRRQVLLRMASMEGEIALSSLKFGNYGDETRFLAAKERLMESPLLINDTSGASIGLIASEARRIKHEYDNLALIVIDYVQLLSIRGNFGSENDRIGGISQAIKSLAWELDVPVMLLSQLNREVERRPDKRPRLADLRASGNLEQDADMVTFLYREDYYDENAERGVVELITRKSRNGPTGTVYAKFNHETMRFSNIL